MSETNELKQKARRRRIETLLLAGYAFAVCGALFVSLLSKNIEPEAHKTDAEDNFDYTTDVLTPVYKDSAQDNPFELVYIQVFNIKLLSDNTQVISKFANASRVETPVIMPAEAKPEPVQQAASFEGIYQKEHRVVMVSSGDSFIGILTKLGMESKNATLAYQALKKVYDARNLKVGQHIEITAVFDVRTKNMETLDTLVIEPVRGTKYILQVNEYDEFVAKVEKEKFIADVKEVSGKISGYVSSSLNKAGVPNKLCNNVIQLFAQAIDFGRDVKKGDTFTVKYEVEKDAKGEVVNVGDVLYASFTLGNTTYKRYRFKARNGDVDYYDENGGARKTGLDKKPLAMKNARISSMYGYRRHPIYKTTKYHSGVDYAAPQGTAIYASGNGVVVMARYVNGYGNYIKIRHNSEYETAYAHQWKFAAGIKPGVRVKKGQIIGYVGSTGQSTGPHLHFEILKNGQRIDPLKAKVATGTDLTGSQLAEFKRTVQKIDKMPTKESEQKPTEVAEKAKSDVKVAENTVKVEANEKIVSDATNLVKIPDAEAAQIAEQEKIAEDTKNTQNVQVAAAVTEEAKSVENKETEETSTISSVQSVLSQKLGDIFSSSESHKTEESASENVATSLVASDDNSEEKNTLEAKIKAVYPGSKSAQTARTSYFGKKWSQIKVPSKKPSVAEKHASVKQ